uniref:Uncharacterized protein n=1 Tax=viral metagenome TaxID=1070528 RepID=A0A6C0C0Y9_9ZZZZ
MSLNLRQALRQSLSALHAQILTDGSQHMRMHRDRAHYAEISCVRILLSTCLAALTGEVPPPDAAFMTPGSIKDSQDVVSCAARELHALREEVDEELLHTDNLPRYSRAIIQVTLAEETAVTEDLEKIENRHADVLERTLSICSAEMCNVLCTSLLDAAPCHLTTEQREHIARSGAAQITSIAACWLAWYTKFEPEKRPPRPLDIPQEATIVCMQNKAVGKYVNALRRCMHLRRQQARIVSIMRRLAAASRVCDTCVFLRDKISYPSSSACQAS